MFKLNHGARVGGTSLRGGITTSYAKLKALFGEAKESDGHKVSSEWVFEDEDGSVATLYDWKQTSLYDEEYPSVDEFRAQSSYDWHIGAKTPEVAVRFEEWLDKELKKL
jgi:hypothetical protein